MGGHRAAALKRASGEHYERLALAYLRRQGLGLVAQNVRCRFGEIDLVMRDEHILVVVEVRYRRSNAFASAALSVSYGKQQKIARTANWFLGRNPRMAESPLRFDVVGFDRDKRNPADDECKLQWLKDAFRPGSPF